MLKKMGRKSILLLLADFLLITLVVTSSNWLLLFSQQDPIDVQKLSGEFTAGETLPIFDNQMITPPTFLAEEAVPPFILGQTNVPKRIEVDLTNQRLYAYEADKLVFNFLISSGKWSRTPTGTFRIWTKLRYTKMSGGSKALGTYYYLPNVPYVMFFYNGQTPKSRGFGLHGTYWHNNFGHPMSHGCINMKTEEVSLLYNWADPYLADGQTSVRATEDNPGTEIVIYGQTPAE